MQETNGQEPDGSNGTGDVSPNPKGLHPWFGLGRTRDAPPPPEPAIMQRQHERSRVVVDGHRTDDNTRCSLVVIHEVGDTWGLYPHGWGKFGVRLTRAEAVKAAQAILDGAQ